MLAAAVANRSHIYLAKEWSELNSTMLLIERTVEFAVLADDNHLWTDVLLAREWNEVARGLEWRVLMRPYAAPFRDDAPLTPMDMYYARTAFPHGGNPSAPHGAGVSD